MKPKMFLLLSAILGMVQGKAKYNNYESDDSNGDDFYRYGKTVNDAAMKECHDYTEIARWINGQVLQADKLTHFNDRLGELINAVNGSDPIEHCCFYEKHTMGNIIENINKMASGNGTVTIQSTGDLGKDLDQILEMMKKLIRKGMTSCCKDLYETLKKLEAGLLKQLEDLKKTSEENAKNGDQQRENLEKGKAKLEGKQNELTEILSNLEKQINGTIFQEAKCCTELEVNIKELNDKVQATHKSAVEEANNWEKQLKNLSEQQNEQNKTINDARSILESRTDNIKKTLEKCKAANKNESDKGSVAPFDLADAKNKIKQLDEVIEKLSHQLSQLINTKNNTLSFCQEMQADIARVEQLMGKLLKASGERSVDDDKEKESSIDGSQQKQIDDLQKKVNELENQLEKSTDCCENIEKLGESAQKFRNNITNMNSSYTEHIKRLEKSIEDLNKRLDEALEKINKLKSKSNANEMNPTGLKPVKNNTLGSIRILQDHINEAKKDLNEIKNRLNESQTEIALLFENCSNKNIQLNSSLVAKIQASDDFYKQVHQRLDEIDEKLQKKKDFNSDDIVKRLEHLEQLYDTLSKDIAKVLQLQNRLDELEKLVKEPFSKFTSMEAEVSECLVKCQKMSKVHDLIDRMEDLETSVKKCQTTAKGSSIVKNAKVTPRPIKRKKMTSSAIGGAEYVSNKYGENWLKN